MNVYKGECGGIVPALTVVQECIRRSGNPGLHSLTTPQEHSLRILQQVRNSAIELIPTRFERFKKCQGWEDINHSVHHDFETGLIKPEWCVMDIQTREWAPRERA